MATHKKDLRRANFSGDDSHLVVVTDDSDFPILKTVFLNGTEMVLPADVSVTIHTSANDVTRINLDILTSSLEVIKEQEMEQRLQ